MNKEFKVHVLTDEGRIYAQEIAKAFDDCLSKLIKIRGGDENPSRYMSLVKTKLEEACFFAKKDMAEKNCI